MRLFTAVSLPDAATNHLDSALGGIGGSLVADPGAGLRWTPRGNRHITLAFHGNVPDGAVPGYISALSYTLGNAEVEPFEVALAGGGSFGGRTLWAGIGDGERQLKKLSGIVESAAADAGLWPDQHAGSRPHVTLARLSSNRGEAHRRSGRRNSRGSDRAERAGSSGARGDTGLDAAPLANLDAWARALAIYRGPLWQVETVQVFRSELGKGQASAPLYTEIAAIPLRADFSDRWLDPADDAATPASAGSRLTYPLRFS